MGDRSRAERAAGDLTRLSQWWNATVLSNHWMVTPQLQARVVELGVRLEPAVRGELSRLAAAAAASSGHIAFRAAEAMASLEDAGIAVAGFKGIAVVGGLGRSPAQRMMSDVDLVVDPGDVARLCEHLAALGYTRAAKGNEPAEVTDLQSWPPDPKQWSRLGNFGVVLRNADGIELDVHWQIGRSWAMTLSATGVVARSEIVSLCGRSVRVAAPVDAVLLAADHATRNGLVLRSALKDLHDVRSWCALVDDRWAPTDLARASRVAGRTIPMLGVLTILRRHDPTHPGVEAAVAGLAGAASSAERRRAGRLADVFEQELDTGELDRALLHHLSLMSTGAARRARRLIARRSGGRSASPPAGAGHAETRRVDLRRWARHEVRPRRMAAYVAVLRAQQASRPRPSRRTGSRYRIPAALPAARPAVASPPVGPDRYRRHLAESILPFWMRHSVDTEHGGFLTNLDRTGRVYDTSKVTVMQARMVYALSSAYEELGDPALLAAARHGAGFLMERIWDADAGGWHHLTTQDGRVVGPEKRLLDQAFALLAVSQYARVASDERALEQAVRAWRLLDRHAWDGQRLGFYEVCGPAWDVTSNRKTVCVQLDMLEALRSLRQLEPALGADDAEAIDVRMAQLVDVIGTRMLDPHFGCLVETCHADWRYDRRATDDLIQVGHNLKAAWMLADMHGAGELPPAALALARDLTDYAFRHALDTHHGGLHQFLRRRGSVASPVKEWWTQCEGILALVAVGHATADPRYADHLADLERYAFTYFVDPVHGEWYTLCDPDGTVRDSTKGSWRKAAYHTTRMCIAANHYLSAPPAAG